MKRAYQYIRISEEDQSNWSISGQQDMNLRFAKTNEIEIIQTFIDDGKSARNFDRPAWKELLSALKKDYRTIDFILVNRYNRFARNAGEGILLIEKLEQRYGIRVISVMENISIDPHSPFFFKMRADMLVTADFERRVISDQSKAGVWRAKSEGRYIGRAPFGYLNQRDERNKPIIVKDESKTAVFETALEYFFLDDQPWATVKAKLKAAGYNRQGNGAMKRLLLNPVYYGLLEVSAYKSFPAQIVEAQHEPWFPVHYWDIAKERLEINRRDRTIHNIEVPLRGFICCPNCNNTKLTGGPSRGKGGNIYMYYRCNSCKLNYSANKAHSELEEILKQLSLTPVHIEVLQRHVQEEISRQTEKLNAKLPKLQKEITELEKKLNAVEDKYFAGDIDDSTYRKWGGIYRRDLSGKREELRRINETKSNTLEKLNRQLPKLGNLRFLYRSCDTVGDKQQLLRLVFGSRLTLVKPGYQTPYISPLFLHNLGEINLLEVRKGRKTPPENGVFLTSTPDELLIKHILQIGRFLHQISA